MTESHKKQDIGDKDKLFYVLDTRDNLVSFICKECIKKHLEKYNKDLVIDYITYNIGKCPDALHSKSEQIKEYPLTNQEGYISIDNIPEKSGIKGSLGIQIAKDGRVWICINGVSLLRFRPELKG